MRSILVTLSMLLACMGFVTGTASASLTKSDVLDDVRAVAGGNLAGAQVRQNAFPQTDLVTRPQGTGTQTLIHIRGSRAPQSFEFPVNLPLGGRLVSRRDGGVDVLDAFGQTVSQLAPPWAKDALGRNVTTSYRVEGGSVLQVVKHAGAAYPVVADPWVIPAIWVYRIIRCGGGAYLGWINSGGWRWWQRAVGVTFGCILSLP